jgi:hypothetical protein
MGLRGLASALAVCTSRCIRLYLPLYFLAAGMVVSGMMIHTYMGAVFPEARPSFYSMIAGMVDKLYA